MLKKISAIIKDKGLIKETINMLLGVLMLVAIIVYAVTKTIVSLYFLVLTGALMTIMNGFTYLKKKEKKALGTSMIVFGVVIVVMFFILVSNGFVI